MLRAEVAGGLPGVLSLAVCVLVLAALSEGRVVSDSVYLRLLPVVERVRLQVASVTCVARRI